MGVPRYRLTHRIKTRSDAERDRLETMRDTRKTDGSSLILVSFPMNINDFGVGGGEKSTETRSTIMD